MSTTTNGAMPSSGAAAKPTFHDGRLKPYPHEELGTPDGVRTRNPFFLQQIQNAFSVIRFYIFVHYVVFLLLWRWKMLWEWKDYLRREVLWKVRG
jgi:hypothetical protein